MKKVTLPIANLDIFEELAKSYLETEGHKPNDPDYADRIEGAVYDLAMEAYLFSFTPSGEIGSNPRTPKVADSFFREFDDVLGPKGFFKTKLTNSDPEYVASKERQFKSILVNLSQLYLETQAKLKTKGRELSDKSYDPSSFEHGANAVKGKPTEEELQKMIKVETNRYIRLFMTTYFTHIVFDGMRTDANSIIKIINSLGLLNGPEADTDSKGILRYLKDTKTRSAFVKLLRDHLSEFKLKALE